MDSVYVNEAHNFQYLWPLDNNLIIAMNKTEKAFFLPRKLFWNAKLQQKKSKKAARNRSINHASLWKFYVNLVNVLQIKALQQLWNDPETVLVENFTRHCSACWIKISLQNFLARGPTKVGFRAFKGVFWNFSFKIATSRANCTTTVVLQWVLILLMVVCIATSFHDHYFE
jgi:hypothetical protein